MTVTVTVTGAFNLCVTDVMDQALTVWIHEGLMRSSSFVSEHRKNTIIECTEFACHDDGLNSLSHMYMYYHTVWFISSTMTIKPPRIERIDQMLACLAKTKRLARELVAYFSSLHLAKKNVS